MKVAIDARMVKPATMHGIARYVHELLHCLRYMKPEHQFDIIVNKESSLEKVDWPDHMRLVPIKARWISFREQWELPKLLKDIKADLFHSPSFVAPLVCPCRMLMTIHDLNHMVLSQFYTPFHLFYYQMFVRSCMKRSEFVLTVSKFSREEIISNLELDPEKIFVTYNGVSSRFQPIHDQNLLDYVRDVYSLPEKFIFCLSNNKPHKNIHRLVRAWGYSDINLPLVLASPVDEGAICVAENYGKKHLLYFARFLQEEHLPAVYSMSEVFVYPSTYEGFGLPPLEALACGTPVVVARSSSLPEVVGDHAIFAHPYDYQDIARALQESLKEKDKGEKEQERLSGIEHAKKYSWENMAIQTLETYEHCVQKPLGQLEGGLV